MGGDIRIDPYKPERLNPNSYNLSLHEKLLVYDHPTLDMRRENTASPLIIPKDGLLLETGKLYLGRTQEYTETQNLVPMLEGRSSIGRLGLFVHITAGFGDVGFKGFWTLEMFCVQPIRIYAGVEICQIFTTACKAILTPIKAGNTKGIPMCSPVCCSRISMNRMGTTDIKPI